MDKIGVGELSAAKNDKYFCFVDYRFSNFPETALR